MPTLTFAHCDTMDGPVVIAAKKAIETKNPNYFLIWVQGKDEAKILEEFKKTLDERAKDRKNTEAIDIAFFGNLVKIHREGEGAEYTGLKPAGSNMNPLLPVADEAIDSGSSVKFETFLSDALRKEVNDRFKEVIEKKNYPLENVQGGREYIESYVTFLHWTEGLYEKLESKESEHGAEWEALHKEGASHEEGSLHAREITEEKHISVAQNTEHSTIGKRNIYELVAMAVVGILFGVGATLVCTRIFRKNTSK